MLASMPVLTALLVTATGVAAERDEAPAYHCGLNPFAPHPTANLTV